MVIYSYANRDKLHVSSPPFGCVAVRALFFLNDPLLVERGQCYLFVPSGRIFGEAAEDGFLCGIESSVALCLCEFP